MTGDAHSGEAFESTKLDLSGSFSTKCSLQHKERFFFLNERHDARIAGMIGGLLEEEMCPQTDLMWI